MEIINKIKSFSFVFLLFVAALNGINHAFGLHLEQILALNPQMVLQEYQLWRLLSFPFILTDISFIFIFGVVFLLFSPILENYLNKYLYPIFLFLISMLQGFVLTLLMWNKTVYVSGIEGLSFFVLVLLVLAKPRERLFPKIPLNMATAGLAIFLLWIVAAFMPVASNENVDFIAKSSSAIFGITLGISVFVPIRYMEKYLMNREKAKAEPKIRIPKPEELSMAVVSSANLKKVYTQFQEEPSLMSDDPDENENILNGILDKINHSGKESLSSIEIKFLEDYSKQL